MWHSVCAEGVESTNGMIATDFSIWVGGGAGPATPDFSSTGSAITLGYISHNTTVNAGFTISHGIDNFAGTIDHAAIPEPGTLA